jgi:hypothetical protein
MLTSVKIVDGAREMILLPRQTSGVLLQAIDAPMPEVREIVENRTDDDGTRDTTSLFGARACSIELLVTQSPRAVEDELTRFLHPRSRPYLVVEDDGWSQARRLGLRAGTFDAPLTLDTARWDGRRISVGWKVPTGIWEADETTEETVVADAASGGVGFSLPFSLPLALTATTDTGAYTVSNLGSIPSHFVARLYGPCSGPVLKNESTGEEIRFTTTLSLASGEYVEIDTRERTANLLSTENSRLSMLDFAATSWWRIEPGETEIRYAPQISSPGAAAVITYRPAWL